MQMQNVTCTSRLLILLILLLFFVEVFFTCRVLDAVILLLHVALLAARVLQTVQKVVHERVNCNYLQNKFFPISTLCLGRPLERFCVLASGRVCGRARGKRSSSKPLLTQEL